MGRSVMPSQIYTRGGDRGETSLVDGSRTPKDSTRVEAYGAVDEANSWIGAARAATDEPLLQDVLAFAQHRFFNCSSNLATPAGAAVQPPRIAEEDVTFLERAIDRFEASTGALHRFIVPGGGPAAGFLHVARTVCRRAERALVRLAREAPVDPLVQKFINRSSDLLFAAARYANFAEGRADVFWDPAAPPPSLADKTP
jgi:cob(I)alamin adenosyltransferase